MLHYTGHGSPSCLIFENENGEANLLVRGDLWGVATFAYTTYHTVCVVLAGPHHGIAESVTDGRTDGHTRRHPPSPP